MSLNKKKKRQTLFQNQLGKSDPWSLLSSGSKFCSPIVFLKILLFMAFRFYLSWEICFLCYNSTGKTLLFDKAVLGVAGMEIAELCDKREDKWLHDGGHTGLLWIHASPTELPLWHTHTEQGWQLIHEAFFVRWCRSGTLLSEAFTHASVSLALEQRAWPIFSPNKHVAGHPAHPPYPQRHWDPTVSRLGNGGHRVVNVVMGSPAGVMFVSGTQTLQNSREGEVSVLEDRILG